MTALDRWNAIVTPVDRAAPSGPLEHLRLSVKDTFETAGVRTTAGARRYRDHVPARDAVAVARLTSGGAQLVGKSNTSALAGDFETSNVLFGRTRNPWGSDLTVGGSSGGSAAAVVAGLADIDLGSDTVGSARIPAHFCGAFSFKPTFGRISTRGHIPPAPGTVREHDITTVGVLGAELEHVATASRFLLGDGVVDPPDGGAVPGGSVAVWHRSSPSFPVSEEVAVTVRAFGADLGRIGVATVESDPTDLGLDRILAAAFRHVGASTAVDLNEAQVAESRAIVSQLEGDRAGALLQMIIGSIQSHRDWQADHELLGVAREAMLALLSTTDAIVCPVAPVVAYRHQADVARHQRSLDVDGTTLDYFLQLSWCVPASVFGLPAIVVPTTEARTGLPVGVQFIGRPFGDEALLALVEGVCQRLGLVSAPRAIESTVVAVP